jgi:hypothetical protein
MRCAALLCFWSKMDFKSAASANFAIPARRRIHPRRKKKYILIVLDARSPDRVRRTLLSVAFDFDLLLIVWSGTLAR